MDFALTPEQLTLRERARRFVVDVLQPLEGDLERGGGRLPKATADELRRVCPVVASFGELEKPFLDQARRLERLLAEVGVVHDVKIYPGVGHAFMNDHGGGPLVALGRLTPLHAAYDETAADDAWRRMLGFFARHL